MILAIFVFEIFHYVIANELAQGTFLVFSFGPQRSKNRLLFVCSRVVASLALEKFQISLL